METVIIVIHLMVIVALIALVLMQRSEGGALGIGGSGNFMSTRGQGNILTRSTAILAAVFFVTSLGMTILARIHNERPGAILDNISQPAGQTAPAGTTPAAPTGGGTILDQIENLGKPATPAAPAVPTTDGAAAPAAPTTPAAPGTPQVPTSQ
jgi:preprotein translocase subunit SecG